MKTTSSIGFAPNRQSPVGFWPATPNTLRRGVFLLFTLPLAVAGVAADLKMMLMGLGSGTVTSTPAGINCGGTCNATFASSASVTLTAVAAPGSVFSHWEGDASGSAATTTPILMNVNRAVRAVFNLSPDIPPLTGFTPADIQTYLAANPQVNTPARFIRALPLVFKQNWILMTRSESLQTGTAEYPRILLPSVDARFVFTIGLVEHGSFPGSHPNAIEYMQWDAVQKNFRFHEIVLDAIPAMPPATPIFPARSRGVKIDDAKCSKCHSTRNILNNSSFPGTDGLPGGSHYVGSKNKPNWDTYDSWGGMTPFNRDRIYQGSVEAAAFRKIFNLWTWQTNPAVRAIIEQLELQPPGVPGIDAITRTNGGANDGHINFAFDLTPPVFIEPAPVGSEPPITTNYSFDAVTGIGSATSVVRGGQFVRLHHSGSPASDEGRGVQLFDLLGGADGDLNQQRIADEIVNHRFATSNYPIDIRPIALAITKFGVLQISGSTVQSVPPLPPLTIDLSFFNARNGMTVNQVYTDTETRAKILTRRKADIQKHNLARNDWTNDVYLSNTAPANGLIQVYGAGTSAGTGVGNDRLRQEVFRRPTTGFSPDGTVMGGIYVDRELYTSNTTKLALYRYFLEPLGVSVDKWSMGVRGRSRTYTFADVFGTYLNVIQPALVSSLTSNPVPGFPNAATNNTELIGAINATLATLPPAGEVPRYTDIQRIFNKSCIECHGGLNYPPYSNFGTFLDLSEDENPPAGDERLTRAHGIALSYTTTNPATSLLFQRLIDTDESCPYGVMPCGGPALSQTDIETVRRWITGGRPYTHGDPHISTIDGVNYDFQAAGEFVLLRSENLEMQARQAAVATAGPLGPNPHTGLTSCVSLNTAIAFRIGRHRITYQPNLSGEPDPSGLQLRIDGELQRFKGRSIPLSSGGRILQTSAPGGIQVEAPGGTVIVITPGWWEHYQLWYLNVDARHVRATEGLMGVVSAGNWLPAMPDGTLLGPRPRSLQERYKTLYYVFGKAWQVTDSTSLFDYAPGTSTRDFSIETWPNGESSESCELPKGKPPLKTITVDEATRLCAGIRDENKRRNCIQDVMITGEPGFAESYLAADKIEQNKLPEVPTLIFPEDFKTDITLPVKFSWNPTTDADGDPLEYKLYVWPVNENPDNNKAVAVESGRSLRCPLIVGLAGLLLLALLYFFGLLKKSRVKFWLALAILVAVIIAYFFCKPETGSKTVADLKSGQAYFWKVIVEDGKGGTVESATRRFEIK